MNFYTNKGVICYQKVVKSQTSNQNRNTNQRRTRRSRQKETTTQHDKPKKQQSKMTIEHPIISTPTSGGDYSTELQNDATWCEAMQINHRVTRTALANYLEQYRIDNICGDKGDTSLSEAKRHFNNWLRRRMAAERDEQRKCNNRPLTAEEARAKRLQGYMSVLTDPQSFMR